jgi:hypothetical protein
MTDTLRPPPSARTDHQFDRLHEIPHIEVAPPGTSLFRRRIRIVNVDSTTAVGELEDDCHHFRIELHHDSRTIITADGHHLRGPWSTCRHAPDPLRAIEGRPLQTRAAALGEYTDARANCTHLFDLAGLTMAHAARGGSERQYDMIVTDPRGPTSAQEAVIWRDGDEIARWQLEQREIVAPADWAGAPLRNKFISWAEDRFEPDTAEAVIALRRIIDIALSRMADLDRIERAADVTTVQMMGRCMTYSPEHIAVALRVKGSARSWEHHGHLMLADMHLRHRP